MALRGLYGPTLCQNPGARSAFWSRGFLDEGLKKALLIKLARCGKRPDLIGLVAADDSRGNRTD